MTAPSPPPSQHRKVRPVMPIYQLSNAQRKDLLSRITKTHGAFLYPCFFGVLIGSFTAVASG